MEHFITVPVIHPTHIHIKYYDVETGNENYEVFLKEDKTDRYVMCYYKIIETSNDRDMRTEKHFIVDRTTLKRVSLEIGIVGGHITKELICLKKQLCDLNDEDRLYMSNLREYLI